MGLFNGYEKEIAAREKALEEYKNAMINVENDADKVLSLIPSIMESLSSYETERKQFVDAVISALGLEKQTTSISKSIREPKVNESYPKLDLKNQLGLGDNGNVYIGFERRKTRNGGNAASLWLKHLTNSYKNVKVTILDNWENSGLTGSYLLEICQSDDDIVNELAEFDFNLTPGEAIEAQRFTSVDEVEIVTENESIADIYS